MSDFNDLYVPLAAEPAPAAAPVPVPEQAPATQALTVPVLGLQPSPAHVPATPAEPAKPPAQVLSVNGMNAPSIVIHDHKINWALVASLPPFQMFIAERDGPNQTGENAHFWATSAAMRLAAAVNDQALLEEYSAWHAAKGYWPGETPLGAPKG
ncbi:hypothetical protein ACFIQF_22630 [Comamonas sp. J-3]|uniref:hypothetical protein n=1 Tax=Comamonas trifloxystrobinivorans TaxID=3350256 RepID=UPI00372A37ED